MTMAAPRHRSPAANCRYLTFAGSGLTVPKDRKLLIGRDARAADIIVDEKSASGRHAFIYYRDGHYFIEDLGSLNGTYLNEQRITEIEALVPDDVIRIWPLEMVFTDVEPPELEA